MEKLDKTSMQYRLDKAGIETIREIDGIRLPNEKIQLRYNGITMDRPRNVQACASTCKTIFGISI